MTCPEWLFGPAMRARNTAVLEKLMAPFCSDERHTACFALTEPAGGCNGEDPTQRGMALKTTAKLDGNEWVINGAKRWPAGRGSPRFTASSARPIPTWERKGSP